MNLAVFLDGTWNDPSDCTNVFQLYTRTGTHDRYGRRQLRYYDAGVGSGRWDRLRGGVFGWGIDTNLIEGYRFLASRYEPGDCIYLFGFSRGATTARSLAAMITHNGLVHPSDLPAKRVYQRYRRRKEVPGLLEMHGDRGLAKSADDWLILERSKCARIHFTGVFDTVGSLGVPGGFLRFISRRRYGFHDTNLSGLNDHAYQALAVDEHRRDFRATLWKEQPARVDCPDRHQGEPCTGSPPGSLGVVEQRWYAGAHTNVGGGGTKSPEEGNPLSILAREWIADKAEQAGLQLDAAAPGSGREWRGPISDSHGKFIRGWYGRVFKRDLRPIAETFNEMPAPELERRHQAIVGYRPENPGFEQLVP